MKKTTLFIVSFLLLFIPFSCKKFIQQQEQNALVNLVTKGTWRITGYTDYQAVNLTDSFSGYSFQFYENGTVYEHKVQRTNQRHLDRRCKCQVHYVEFSVSFISDKFAEFYMDRYRQLF